MENNFIKSCLVTFLRAITQRKNKRQKSYRQPAPQRSAGTSSVKENSKVTSGGCITTLGGGAPHLDKEGVCGGGYLYNGYHPKGRGDIERAGSYPVDHVEN